MPEVIEGLHYDVPTSTVTRLLDEKIEQCKIKAELYARQAEEQEKLTAGMKQEAEFAKFSSDQSANLKKKAEQYAEQVKQFAFLREHVIKGVTYRLTYEDMRFLGIIKDRY